MWFPPVNSTAPVRPSPLPATSNVIGGSQSVENVLISTPFFSVPIKFGSRFAPFGPNRKPRTSTPSDQVISIWVAVTVYATADTLSTGVTLPPETGGM
ncbi:hypothetical protein D3C71_1839360 [compost metagenome]